MVPSLRRSAQQIRRAGGKLLFARYWRRPLTDFLMYHFRPGHVPDAPDAQGGRGWVLLIEDRIPYPALGAGLPRSAAIVQSLVELGYLVSIYSMSLADRVNGESTEFTSPQVDLITGLGAPGFARFLKARGRYYAACIVSRPHNMQRLRRQLLRARQSAQLPMLLYDAEALFSRREASRREAIGRPLSPEAVNKSIAREVELASGVDAVLTVSEQESQHFKTSKRPVYVLPHRVRIAQSPPHFASRSGFLFVGALYDSTSPNVDAMTWFTRGVFPLLQERLGNSAHLSIAGIYDAGLGLLRNGIALLGRVKNLESLYNTARVFIAPTRFGAGVPLKLYEAAAAGIPIVCTTLLANQLNWEPGVHLLAADGVKSFTEACVQLHEDEVLWTRLQRGALDKANEDCSPSRFRSILTDALESSSTKNDSSGG